MKVIRHNGIIFAVEAETADDVKWLETFNQDGIVTSESDMKTKPVTGKRGKYKIQKRSSQTHCQYCDKVCKGIIGRKVHEVKCLLNPNSKKKGLLPTVPSLESAHGGRPTV